MDQTPNAAPSPGFTRNTPTEQVQTLLRQKDQAERRYQSLRDFLTESHAEAMDHCARADYAYAAGIGTGVLGAAVKLLDDLADVLYLTRDEESE